MNRLLTIPRDLKKGKHQVEFDRIAKKLLNTCELRTPENAYLIREIEFYYYSDNHTDYYCHKNSEQLNNSTFYFHRFKDPEKYLRLKQKGIDITFGNQSCCEYGGILIRAIQNINSGNIFTGIGKLTNHIIGEIGGPKEIQKLYNSGDVFKKSSNLHLFCSDNNQLKIFKKCRQGLNHKPKDTDKFYLNATYNYFTYPEISELL